MKIVFFNIIFLALFLTALSVISQNETNQFEKTQNEIINLFSSNSSTQEFSRISFELEKILFDENYKAKSISKNNVSDLLIRYENYAGGVKYLGKELKKKFREKLNNLVCLRGNKIDYAIVITELNTQLFPDDGNLWDTIGDVYFAIKIKMNRQYSVIRKYCSLNSKIMIVFGVIILLSSLKE
jgi:hypothetical protein